MYMYNLAAQLIVDTRRGQKSLKDNFYVLTKQHNNPRLNLKGVFALASETLKYEESLIEILENAQFFCFPKQKGKKKKFELKHKQYVFVVLAYELLFGKATQLEKEKDNVSVQKILEKKARLQSEFVKLKVKKKLTEDTQLISPHLQSKLTEIPKYIRVNTLLTTMDEAEQYLQQTYFKSKDKKYEHDAHISNLLKVPLSVKIDFHKDPWFLQGKLIIQDKASCFSAHVLSPPLNTSVIDCCAAPGNKTSHLAAILKNSGHVFAFEKDKHRYGTLKNHLSSRGCKNTEAVHKDFLTVDPRDPKYKAVTCILADPSCSGSGIVGRLDIEHEENQQPRLESLSQFQKKILIPSVHRVVYSTCSIHHQENEDVVAYALEHHPEFQLATALPDWHRRGNTNQNLTPEQSSQLVRVDPQHDETQGFFVTLFERKTESTNAVTPTLPETPEQSSVISVKSQKTKEMFSDNQLRAKSNKKQTMHVENQSERAQKPKKKQNTPKTPAEVLRIANLPLSKKKALLENNPNQPKKVKVEAEAPSADIQPTTPKQKKQAKKSQTQQFDFPTKGGKPLKFKGNTDKKHSSTENHQKSPKTEKQRPSPAEFQPTKTVASKRSPKSQKQETKEQADCPQQ